MKPPSITGVIRRRLLLNYRVDPDIAGKLLPPPFRPKLIHGHAIAGICLIRLEQIRPKGLPAFTGISSENSAHRIAVQWEDETGTTREGVFVPRRDTDSCINSLLGGRVFPGVQHHARFNVTDHDGAISMSITPDGDETPLIGIQATATGQFPSDSIFSSLEESSRFFEAGCTGYSSRPGSCVMDGMSLLVTGWKVTPLAVEKVASRYYEDATHFPPGSIHFDHGLLMRDIPHEWHPEPEMNTRNKSPLPAKPREDPDLMHTA